MAERGADEGTVVVADEQTAGRGRVGRMWFSPPGQSLYMSVLLRPQLAPSQISWLTMIGALAVVDVVAGLTPSPQPSPSEGEGVGVGIKWFNDVLLNDKKLAGVLVETSFTGQRLDYAILGIGLNVNTRFDDAPEDVRTHATSFRQESGVEFDREVVLHNVLDVFAKRWAMLPASPTTEYASHLGTLGRQVRLVVGDEIIEGKAVRVEADGALVMRTINGDRTSERTIRFGDVMG